HDSVPLLRRDQECRACALLAAGVADSSDAVLCGHAREPESSCGRATETDRLSGQPASLTSGEFEVRIMGASPEEMDGGTGDSRCTITKSDDLGLGSQHLST